MKLVSFRVQTPVGSFVRAGALHGHRVIDLNMACARLLADQHEAQPARLANAMVPATMLELLEGGRRPWPGHVRRSSTRSRSARPRGAPRAKRSSIGPSRAVAVC